MWYNFYHLEHLIKLCFCVWCAKCAKNLAFGTFSTSAVGALKVLGFDSQKKKKKSYICIFYKKKKKKKRQYLHLHVQWLQLTNKDISLNHFYVVILFKLKLACKCNISIINILNLISSLRFFFFLERVLAYDVRFR